MRMNQPHQRMLPSIEMHSETKKAKIGFLVFPFEGILYSSGESEIYKLSEEFISFGEIEKRELC